MPHVKMSSELNPERPSARTILAYGELLWDVFPTGEVLGGAPANFGYRVNSLGHRARLITRLGRDELGKKAAEIVAQNGMSLDCVQWDQTFPTGTVPITLAPDGSPDFTILPNVAYDHIEFTPQLRDFAAEADCICFGTLIQRAETSRKTLYALLDAAPQALKVLDLNLRRDCYSNDTISSSLDRANILKLNEQEAQTLSGLFNLPEDCALFAPAAVKRWNLDCCIVTLGARGLAAADDAGHVVQRPAHKIKVVDTCGAGDAFTAGFLHARFENQSFADCCDYANALGALVAQTRGGTEPVPKEHITRLMAG